MATIQGVYVALFGRPADPLGLAYFNGVTQNGANLTAVGDLAATPEYQNRFKGQSPSQIINSIYKSLFNRDADGPGLTFFANQLATGKMNINNIAINILDGAQGADKTVSDTKIAAANTFTAHVDLGTEIVAYSGDNAAASGRAFLAPISTTAPTDAAVDAAIAGIVTQSSTGGGTAGQTFTLQASAAGAAGDTFTPTNSVTANQTTAGDDTFRADAVADSLQTVDTIDGGAGNDTLNASFTAAATVKPVVSNVETINLKTTATVTYDAGDTTGATAIWDNASSGALTVDNMKLSTAAGLNGNDTGAVTFKFSGATSATDNVKLVIREATAADVTLSANAVGGVAQKLETVTINQVDLASTSTNDATITKLTVTGTSTINVTGEGNLTVGAGGDLKDITKFDASAHKGDLTVDLSTSTAGVTVLASAAGTNAITLGTNTNVDTVVFTAANVSTINKMTTVTGFDAVAEDKLDLKAFNLGADTTVGTTTVAVAGDIGGFFTGTNRAVFNDTTKVLYVDVNKDGNFNAGTDLAVKLAGVATADLSAADFILS
ncbi:DUF4214 domain-containing protein [Alsobacter sp. SYSU BS001988]